MKCASPCGTSRPLIASPGIHPRSQPSASAAHEERSAEKAERPGCGRRSSARCWRRHRRRRRGLASPCKECRLDIRVPPNADIEALEKRIAEEWAPSSRNMTFMFKQKTPARDMYGKPIVTAADSSNPWWTLLEEAVKKANGKLSKPEIFPASTDARYFRELGLPAFGFSPMANTPVLLHDHNEFLKRDEYLKGIEVFESIIKTFASYKDQYKDDESCAEL
ncbi:hypothetical protein J5N97_026234 [Dioscorea zingiberensis]|uniref:Aminoacylase-1 n=1 Tax=Dioscorea zingiberensis TaxID=325984 RepID=A0A9D5C1W4_9LILI|nr:hypothetical protein J5N97_026234 [Dioscorea zingiberensis]